VPLWGTRASAPTFRLWLGTSSNSRYGCYHNPRCAPSAFQAGRGHHGEFGHFPPTSEHSPPRPTLRRYSGRSACASSSCQATRPRATRPSWLAAWSRFSGVGDNNVPHAAQSPSCALTLIKKLNRCALLNRISGRVSSLKPNGMPLP